jgi:hypothetical protein
MPADIAPNPSNCKACEVRRASGALKALARVEFLLNNTVLSSDAIQEIRFLIRRLRVVPRRH